MEDPKCISESGNESVLRQWRQGDCTLGDNFNFYYVAAPEVPSHQARLNDESSELVSEAVLGLVVVSQTCDIVRSPDTKPFLEVSPIVKVPETILKEIKLFLRPGYLYIPGLAGQNLVADIERTMSVEKQVVVDWTRIPGWNTDTEIRQLQFSLARKRQRFAFPDDFNELLGDLQKRIQKKHDKHSPEGDALQGLEQIRVLATPSWDSESVDLLFWFVKGEDRNDDTNMIRSQMDKWQEHFVPSGRFKSAGWVLTTYDDMTAKDYLSSDLLDLDYLSNR